MQFYWIFFKLKQKELPCLRAIKNSGLAPFEGGKDFKTTLSLFLVRESC
jgi:hypothetical protein